VKNQTPIVAPLRVAAKLKTANGKVGATLAFNARANERGHRFLVTLHDKFVCGFDAVARTRGVNPKDQGVVQNAWTLQNCSASGATPQDGNGIGAAERKIDLGFGFVCVSYHDEVAWWFPKPQHLAGAVGLAQFQQGLVASQVFLG
jgi:hypothetical protein